MRITTRILLASALTTLITTLSTTAGPTSGPATAAVRGVEIGVPAYVVPGDPMFTNLQTANPAASVVIVNPDNGDTPFTTAWQTQSDQLRARSTATGEHTRVLGYVYTDYGARPLAAVKASVDNYLKTADGALHVDGIFFDTVAEDCGTNNATRDYYKTLRTYVQDVMRGIDPTAEDLVVDNPGNAIADCYLAPGHRTADTFVTFEGSYADYTGGGWLGGNVFNSGGHYSGAGFDPSGTAYWHLVYAVPNQASMQTVLTTAFARGAGYSYATDAALLPHPWDVTPGWGFSAETSYADAIGGTEPCPGISSCRSTGRQRSSPAETWSNHSRFTPAPTR